MYVPDHFAFDSDDQAFDLIGKIRLGTLVACSDPMQSPGFQATHIPFMVDRDRGTKGVLIGHVARANPHWRTLEQGGPVLVVFMGPAAYVSPSWYHTAPRAPTWTYVSVQAQGQVRLITDLSALGKMVLRLCDESEPPDTGWNSADLPDDFLDRLVRGIVGFEIDIDVLEGAVRLGQNNDLPDRQRVTDALAQGDGQQRTVAAMMRAILDLEADKN